MGYGANNWPSDAPSSYGGPLTSDPSTPYEGQVGSTGNKKLWQWFKLYLQDYTINIEIFYQIIEVCIFLRVGSCTFNYNVKLNYKTIFAY